MPAAGGYGATGSSGNPLMGHSGVPTAVRVIASTLPCVFVAFSTQLR